MASSPARRLVIALPGSETLLRQWSGRVGRMTLPAAQALGVMACAVAASVIYLSALVQGVRSENGGARQK